MPSFDIVSELELFEVNHAVQNTQKVIATRFDFRGHDVSIELNEKNKEIKKAMVLSSGGVDSTTCLGMAVEKYGKDQVIALSISYGQKHQKEIEASRKVAEYYGDAIRPLLS